MKYIILYLASVMLSASLLGYVHRQGKLYSDGLTVSENQMAALFATVVSPVGIAIGGFAISYELAKGK
jgi:hypothetical protein